MKGCQTPSHIFLRCFLTVYDARFKCQKQAPWFLPQNPNPPPPFSDFYSFLAIEFYPSLIFCTPIFLSFFYPSLPKPNVDLSHGMTSLLVFFFDHPPLEKFKGIANPCVCCPADGFSCTLSFPFISLYFFFSLRAPKCSSFCPQQFSPLSYFRFSLSFPSVGFKPTKPLR